MNLYPYPDMLVPIPTTRMGMAYPCICLLLTAVYLSIQGFLSLLLLDTYVEQQNLHKAVACHTLSLPLLFTEVLVLQVLRTNPSKLY